MTTLREPLLKAYYIAVACKHSDKKWELDMKLIIGMPRDEILVKVEHAPTQYIPAHILHRPQHTWLPDVTGVARGLSPDTYIVSAH